MIVLPIAFMLILLLLLLFWRFLLLDRYMYMYIENMLSCKKHSLYSLSPQTNSSTGISFNCNKYSLSLDNPAKLMDMGVSYDFVMCKAIAKSGKPCQNYASRYAINVP